MGYTLAKDFQPPEPQPAYDERGVYRPAWGGIGNLVALYKDGVEAAVYEYSPYGDGARERGDGRSASRTARRAEEAGAPWAATKQLLRSRGPYAQHNPLRYGSKLADPLTGLIDFGHRHYSPALARFITRDPLQEAGGLNLYRYAGNDPVNAIDVLGLSTLTDILTQGGASGNYSAGGDDSGEHLPTIGPVYDLPGFTVEGDSPTPFVDFMPGLIKEFTSDARRIVNTGYSWNEQWIGTEIDLQGARAEAILTRAAMAFNAGRSEESIKNARESRGSRLEDWTEQDEYGAIFSKMVYGVDSGGLLNILDHKGDIRYDPQDGFAAGLWEHNDIYYMALRGTTFTSLQDWTANLKQGTGMASSQYDQAVNLARQVDRWAAANGYNLVMVGHSLGGGLASAAANATGRPAYTYNAAGLSDRYNTGTDGGIRAHYIRGDILSTFQDMGPAGANGNWINSAAGERISHPAINWYDGLIDRHSIFQFIDRDF